MSEDWLTLRDVNPTRMSLFDFSELGGWSPQRGVVIGVTTENDGHWYEIMVVGTDKQGPLVVVRARHDLMLRVPRVASYGQVVRGRSCSCARIEAGTSMVFRYFMPDQSRVEHLSGRILPGGISLESAIDLAPFQTAIRIFQETTVSDFSWKENSVACWSCLVNSGLSHEMVDTLWGNIMTFHPSAQQVLREVFEGSARRGNLHKAINLFEVFFRTIWIYQEEDFRGGVEGAVSDVSAFNKLRELGGVPEAVSIRGDL